MTSYSYQPARLSTKDIRIFVHTWKLLLFMILIVFAVQHNRYNDFWLFLMNIVSDLIVLLVLRVYPSPLYKQELIWRFKRMLRYTREDVVYFLRTKHRAKMLLHRFWSVMFFLETGILNSVIDYRRKKKDFRTTMRYHRLQVKLEKLRRAIYQHCERWREFDDASIQHAEEEYYE